MKHNYSKFLVLMLLAIMAMIPERSAANDAEYEQDSTRMVRMGQLWFRIRDFPVREMVVAGFIDNSTATSVNIPESVTIPFSGASYPVTGIMPGAFKGNKNITSVTFNSSMKEVGEGAFEDTGITDLVIPGTVDSIASNAFAGTPLKTVTFEAPEDPDQKLVIGDNAFDNSPADSFTDCYIDYPDAPTITDNAFPNASNAVLHYPSDLTDDQKDAYDNGTGWKNFKKEVPAAIDTVGIDEADDGPMSYYTITGVNVSADRLTPGIYIVRQGTKVYKTLVR